MPSSEQSGPIFVSGLLIAINIKKSSAAREFPRRIVSICSWLAYDACMSSGQTAEAAKDKSASNSVPTKPGLTDEDGADWTRRAEHWIAAFPRGNDKRGRQP